MVKKMKAVAKRLVIGRAEKPVMMAPRSEDFALPAMIFLEVKSGKNVVVVKVGNEEISGPRLRFAYGAVDGSDVTLIHDKFFAGTDLRLLNPLQPVRFFVGERWGVVLPRRSSMEDGYVQVNFSGEVRGEGFYIDRKLKVEI